MTARLLVTGLMSYLPGLHEHSLRHGNVAAKSAVYCYRVWHRHLLAHLNSGMASFPKTVVELGPGGSIGVGICALLMGAERYIGLDAVPRPVFQLPKGFLNALEQLIIEGEPVPFPQWISAGLDICDLAPLAALRGSGQLDPQSVRDRRICLEKWLQDRHPTASGEEPISYLAPWDQHSLSKALGNRQADLTMSHSVLEYVPDPLALNSVIASFSSPSGRITYHVNFANMTSLPRWNDYWTYSATRWRIMKGRRPSFPSRLPLSAHLRGMEEAGLKIIKYARRDHPTGLQQGELQAPWRSLDESDLSSSALFAVCSVQ